MPSCGIKVDPIGCCIPNITKKAASYQSELLCVNSTGRKGGSVEDLPLIELQFSLLAHS